MHLILPARLDSQRLHRKMLADVGGLPLVVRTLRRAQAVPGAATVTVATDDDAIAEVVRAHGGEVVRTGLHASGTERVAEAARVLARANPDLRKDIVVNVQADEPFLDVAQVVAVAQAARSPGVDLATAAAPLADAEAHDPARVKVVTDDEGRALYFSRAAIPHGGPFRVHVGLYAFRYEALQRVATRVRPEPHPLEASERLEQLRWLAAGLRIAVVDMARAGRSVDTAEDLAWARAFAAGQGQRDPE